MINTSELFNGVAVVIDDELNDPKANIKSIVKQIENQNIPMLKYTSLPEDEVIKHFRNLSFIVLDWMLYDEEIKDLIKNGGEIPRGLKKSIINDNINFIKKINELYYCPIFIFTNETDKDSLINKLQKKNIIIDDRSSNIFVKGKLELRGRTKLFKVLNNWIEKNASIYVLKQWEKDYTKSKSKLFSEFYELSPDWPKVLWKNYDVDGTIPSKELGEFISRSLIARMTPYKFSKEIISKRGKRIDRMELRKVLEGTRFVKDIDDSVISPGDLFKYHGKYYLNVRASCDLIHNRNGNNSIDDIEIYLIKGSKLSENDEKKLYNKFYHLFNENVNNTIVFPIDGGKAIDFQFKDLKIEKWSDWKGRRIGKILPPYIIRIQQKYALYFHRQGLPSIPQSAI